MLGTAAQAEPGKFSRAEGADYGFRAVVAAGAAILVNADGAQRQLHFVPHHQQIAYIQLVLG